MVLYRCNRCEKEFNQKSNYIFHINRKYPCKKITNNNLINDDNNYNNNINNINNLRALRIKVAPSCTNIAPICTKNTKNTKNNYNNHKCSFCSYIFTRKSSLIRHLKNRCKIKNNIAINNVNITNNINMVNSNNRVINNTIKLVKFGEEDLNKISDKVYKMILNKGFQSVPELIKQIHFNDNIPENHNMYISNTRSNNINVYDGDKFILMDQNDIIDALYDEKTFHLEEKYENYSDLPEATKKKFNRFLKNKDDDKHKALLFKTIKRILYNNRKVAIKTRKELDNKNKN